MTFYFALLFTACSSQTPTDGSSPAGPPPNVGNARQAAPNSNTIPPVEAQDIATKPALENAQTPHEQESIGCSGPLELQKGKDVSVECASSGRGAVFSRINLKVFQGKDTFGAQYFYMMTTEVTQGFYQKVMGENLDMSSCNIQGNVAPKAPGQPLYCISWKAAAGFANALNEKLGLETCYLLDKPSKIWPNSLACKGYRLPTPAEWAWAFQGDGLSAVMGLSDRVWHESNSNSQTHIVASLKANGFGLYDMAGNVSEWVYADPDPGPNRQVLGGENRVYSGGSAGDDAEYIVKGISGDAHFSHQDAGLGFRLVRTAY